jgi:hypothetical protein
MPRLSKIGAAALAAFGWTSGAPAVTASYLVVAGGAGGSNGGGGAGGYRTGTASLSLTDSYAVTVGAGGAGGNPNSTTNGTNGSSSVFTSITSAGGGGGGNGSSGGLGLAGGSGGGGGGWDPTSTGGAGNTPSTSPSQGNNGGTGANSGAAGGGGAGAVGSNGSTNTGGAGGAGTASSISGASVTYAGGGGGRGFNTAGAGGSGGGGAGTTGSGIGSAGTANLGGGGGGSGATNAGGQGGSGVVIISYPSPQKFGGGVVTTSGSNTIHTFTTSGTLVPLSSLTASYLIVAGGGGANFGGGGGGGYVNGSGLVIDSNSTYLVTVGAGGTGNLYPTIAGNGSNSAFSVVSTAAVGGGGAGGTGAGANGGSGGGGSIGTNVGGSGTAGQGFAGGTATAASFNAGGGGGGASAVGTNAVSQTQGGNGGNGISSSISGTSVTYAGGGAGCSTNGGGGGTNGSGGGGTANTGGGGGGNGVVLNSGGSGIVIISYAGSTQLMAGGTVTISGGNVIHTFTSSGYLTPLTLVGNSLRFRSSASASLSRTFSTPTNNKIWTWSGWVKLGTFSVSRQLLSAGSAVSDQIFIGDTNIIRVYLNGGYVFESTPVYRDPAAWYHIVIQVDTTQSTAANRTRVYVNGSQVTAFSGTAITQNTDTKINSAIAHQLGRYAASASEYFDGYMTEVQLIDGQALTPNSFGTFNQFGVWQPIRYGGSYGTNGFYLPFSNNASTTTLGLDFSPQGNNWTTNNISVTAGVTYDSMTDVPTLTSTTAANYAVLNPLAMYGTNVLISNANLTSSATSTSNDRGWSSTIAAPSSGKWYAEFTFTSTLGDNNGGCGIMLENGTGVPGESATTVSWRDAGTLRQNASNTSYGSALTTNDVVIVAYDAALGRVWFGKNGTWFASGDPATNANPSATGITSSGRFATYHYNTSAVIQANFGQRPFVYTPPSGFLALNTFNL